MYGARVRAVFLTVCFAFLFSGAIAPEKAHAFSVSGTVYSDIGSTTVASGVTLYAKVGSNATTSTTTSAGGAYTFTTLSGATSTTPIIIYVHASSTLKATTLLMGLGGGSSATNIPLYQNNMVSVSTTTAGVVDMGALTFFDSTSDSDVLYTATAGTTTINTDLYIATSTTKAPSVLVLGGSYTNTSTFLAGSGTLYLSYITSSTLQGTLNGTSSLNNVVAVSTTGSSTPTQLGWNARALPSLTNGWSQVAYGTSTFVALPSYGSNAAATSPDGVVWTLRTAAGDAYDQWSSLTYGGGLFVAVGTSVQGNTSVGTRVMTSPDGVTWTARTAAGDNDVWTSVAYGNGTYVAVGYGDGGIGGDRVMTSPDGITWTVRTPPSSGLDWYGVTYGNGLFVAVSNYYGKVMTSPDGITWTERSAPASQWGAVAFSNNIFVAVASTPTTTVVTSPDAITWTPRTPAVDLAGVSAVNNMFISGIVDDQHSFATSSDGITWSSYTSLPTTYGSFAYGNSRLISISGTTSSVDRGFGLLLLLGTTMLSNLTISTASTTFYGGPSLTVLGNYINNGYFQSTSSVSFASSTSNQTLGGTSPYNFFNNVTFSGSTKTFSVNASTSNFVINSGATVAAPPALTISGNYQNNGTFINGGGTIYFTSPVKTARISGSATGTSAFNNVVFSGSGVKVLGTSTTLSNLTVISGTTLVAPASLTILGNFQNDGGFASGSSTVFSSSTTQTLSGSGMSSYPFRTVAFTGGTKQVTASGMGAVDLSIGSGVTFVAPSSLTVTGSFTNNGLFTSGGSSNQVLVDTSLRVTSGYGFSSSTFTKSVSVAAQEANASDVTFSADGLTMFVIGTTNATVYSYSLGQAFNVATAFLSGSFDVSAKETAPTALAFSPDGYYMFVVGTVHSTVYEYGLSTAFDVSSASYLTSKSISADESQPTGLAFSPDGYHMYTVGTSDTAIDSYNLSGSFDVSTAVFASTFTITSQAPAPQGLALNYDGTRAYVIDSSGKKVLQYNLSTPYAFSSASYSNQTFTVTAQESTPKGIAFDDTGSNVYIVGSGGDKVYTYALAVPFVLDGYKDIVSSYGIGTPSDVAFSGDGYTMFMVEGGTSVTQYNLSTAFNLSTASYVSAVVVNATETNPTGLTFSQDGYNMYVVGTTQNTVYQYSLTNPFDITTGVTYLRSFSVSAQESNTQGVVFDSSGTKMFTVGLTGDKVYQYGLSTAYDISTASFTASSSISAQETNATGVTFNAAGTKMYTIGFTGDKVYEYTLSTPYTVTSKTFVRSVSIALRETNATGLTFSPDGNDLFVVGTSTNTVSSYEDRVYSAPTVPLSGTLSGTSAFATLVLTGVGTGTITSNASTSGAVALNYGTTLSNTARLSIPGDFTAYGTYSDTGTTTFNGAGNQLVTSGPAGVAFKNLEIKNTSAGGVAGGTGVRFNYVVATTSIAGGLYIAPGAAVYFSTYGNTKVAGSVSIAGTAGAPIALNSSSDGTWGLVLLGTSHVSYVDVRNSNACGGNAVTASTSVDRAGNSCWTFDPALPVTFTSAANQTFAKGQATTTAATMTITEGAVPTVTSGSTLRIDINPALSDMRFDTSRTSLTFGGTASGKVNSTVSYASSTELVISATSNFASTDTLTISGVGFGTFGTVGPATSSLYIVTSATGATSTNANTIAITGSLAVSDHVSGQATNVFPNQNQVGAKLFAFKMVPTNESMNISLLTFGITNARNISSGNLSQAALYRDINANGVVDAGDVAVGGTGAVSISGQSGTIQFPTTFLATTSQNYIVTATTSSLTAGANMVMYLSVSGSVTGSTSLAAVIPTGSVQSVTHYITNRFGGGSAIGGDAPPGAGIVGGGGQGGQVIGNVPGFQAPTANGTVYNEWTSGVSALASDNVYATATSPNVRQSYSVFGFTVPPGNTVTGIEVKLEASASSASGTIQVGLSWNGDSTITAVKATPILSTSDTVYTLGSPSDLWGRTWTPAELGNANFFVRVIAQPGSNTVQLDAIQVKPYHIVGGGGQGGGGGI